MWIENCAADEIPYADHTNPGPNSMLIQIMDPPGWFPKPKHNFKEIHQFQFLDIEDHDHADDPEMFISEEQAKSLVALLKRAQESKMNVIVHCFAGICRSGAVVEVATHLGFETTGKFREPNTRVMRLMMTELGLPYEIKTRT